MFRNRLRSHIAVASLFAAAGLAACSKTDSPPGGFGVNITVDATSLSTATRARIKTATLHALSDKAGATAVSRSIDKFADAVQGGTVRFHYTPAATVKEGESLTFGVDAFDGAKALVASGSSDPVLLRATAVEVKITLVGLGDAGAPPADGDGSDVGEVGSGKTNGIACIEGTECATGFCADGVCCNELCNDLCVSCKLPASKGTCTPYAVDTDPEMQCGAREAPVIVPDQDASSAPATDGAATGDASAAEASASDAAAAEVAESDAAVINPPDGGFMSMPKSCGGTCSGMRSCKYPGKTTSCGKAFCNTRKDVGSFVCDGAGGCNIDLSMCDQYACDEGKGACNTACASHLDCQLGFYCNGNGQCAPRKVNGVMCATDAECRQDHCSTGVCCNTACDAPFSCNATGSVGQCKCPGVTCAAGVACQVFYADADGDTFGNRNGTITAGTAKAGCAGAPPAGFVADNTDCDDGDADAHPGQTGWFHMPSKGTGTYDYNCDGMMNKETPEYVGKSCHFCGMPGTCEPGASTCGTANQTASFQCPQELLIFKTLSEPVDLPIDLEPRMSFAPPTPGPAAAAPGAAAAAPAAALPPIGPVLPPIMFPQCCGCQPADKTGFLQAVNCGDATKYVYTCGACAAVNGGASASTRVLKQQQCH